MRSFIHQGFWDIADYPTCLLFPQSEGGGIATVNWSNGIATIQDDGTAKTFSVNPPTGNRFFRLFKP